MTSPSASSPPPRKRKRNNSHKVSSIYIDGPSKARAAAASAVRDKGKQRALEPSEPIVSDDDSLPGEDGEYRVDEDTADQDDSGGSDDQAGRAQIKRAYRERTVRGWETRKGWSQASSLVTRDQDEDRLGDVAADDLPSDHLAEARLTPQDLLHALHAHASAFYSSTSLLLPPHRQVRAEHWDSKKRLLLRADGIRTENKASSASIFNLRTNGHSRRGPNETAASAAPSEAGDDDRDVSEPDGEKPRRKKRGKYIKRDMYGALDGSALLALGILVEEHIKGKLFEAGYRPAGERLGEAEEMEDEAADDEITVINDVESDRELAERGDYGSAIASNSAAELGGLDDGDAAYDSANG